MEDLPSATVSSNNLEEWAQEHRGDYGVVYKRKPSVQLKIERCYLPNSSGCAQTEGVYKIPLSEKRKYLPQYAKAQRSREEAKTQAAATEVELAQTRLGSGPQITTTRAGHLAKQNSAIEVAVKKATIPNEDGDKVRFNKLSKRTNDLRLGRSAIHGWGLFSEAKIAANDMVIVRVCRRSSFPKGLGKTREKVP